MYSTVLLLVLSCSLAVQAHTGFQVQLNAHGDGLVFDPVTASINSDDMDLDITYNGRMPDFEIVEVDCWGGMPEKGAQSIMSSGEDDNNSDEEGFKVKTLNLEDLQPGAHYFLVRVTSPEDVACFPTVDMAYLRIMMNFHRDGQELICGATFEEACDGSMGVNPLLAASTHSHGSMDMSGMDMSGMDHSGMDHSGMDMSGMDMSGTDHTTTVQSLVDMGMARIWDGPAPASLSGLTATPDALGGFRIKFDALDYTFAPQDASTSHVAGEGHAHWFLDATKQGRVYCPAVYIYVELFCQREVAVTFNANDHQPYILDGEMIQVTTVIDVGSGTGFAYASPPNPASTVVWDGPAEPTITMSITADPMSGYNIVIETTNFEWDIDNVDHVQGAGYIQLFKGTSAYIITRLYCGAHHYNKDLFEDTDFIAYLTTNDHQRYIDTSGVEISVTATVVLTPTPTMGTPTPTTMAPMDMATTMAPMDMPFTGVCSEEAMSPAYHTQAQAGTLLVSLVVLVFATICK